MLGSLIARSVLAQGSGDVGQELQRLEKRVVDNVAVPVPDPEAATRITRELDKRVEEIDAEAERLEQEAESILEEMKGLPAEEVAEEAEPVAEEAEAVVEEAVVEEAVAEEAEAVVEEVEAVVEEAEAVVDEGAALAAEAEAKAESIAAEAAALAAEAEAGTADAAEAMAEMEEALAETAESPEDAVEEAIAEMTEEVEEGAAEAEKVAEEVTEEAEGAAEEMVEAATEEAEAATEEVESAVEEVAVEEPAVEEVAVEEVAAEEVAVEEPAAEEMAAEEVAEDEPAETAAEEAGEPEAEPAAPRGRRSRRSPGETHTINTLTINGDRQLLEDLDLLGQLESEVIGSSMNARGVRDLAQRYAKLVVAEGYYLASVFAPPAGLRRLSDGEVVLNVDQGRIGETRFYSKTEEETAEKVPYTGRWYSEKQLRRRLGNLQPGNAFYYDDFYKSVFRVNSHPDLTMDTDLQVRKEREDDRQVRYVDMEFAVRERIPLHAVLELQNSGTEATEELRGALTVQHLNLTKHDDVFTLTLPASLDFSTVRSIAGSYYFPYHAGNGGAFTLYGGYSELDTDDLVPDVDLQGEGYFTGFQVGYDLWQTDAHSLKVAAGIAYQVVEDTLVLGDAIDTPREVTIAPLSLVATYSSVRPDRLGGRNFLTSQSSISREGFLGTSDDEEFSLQRETAEADYWIERLQFARIQPVTFKEPASGAEAKQWIIFLKLDGQIASGALVPAEQKAVGGLDNVRGYEEREILGDNGISAALELRSPIWSASYTKKYVDTGTSAVSEGAGSERLQVVAFLDGAYMELEDALPAVEDNINLLSVGLGVRLAVTRYTQFKFDWGFPLEETEESDSTGRGHISIELQI